MNVQYGCGLCAPNEWENFDSSPTIFLQRLPVIGGFFKGGRFPVFPKNVHRGSISKGLPLKDNCADLVYCSHVLEHLSLEEFRFALDETKRILKPNGVFRFVLPDLEFHIKEYMESNANPERAMKFMMDTLLGKPKRERGLTGFLKTWLGGSSHYWMWDFDSIAAELKRVGFTQIQKANYGDSDQKEFQSVEDAGRWKNCLSVQCIKNDQ